MAHGLKLSRQTLTLMKKFAVACWNGPGKDGKGSVSTQSKALENSTYTFESRFINAAGTNPEELLAAAHAMCFTMKLSFVLGEAGFTPGRLETKAFISVERGAITASHLTLTAQIKGISEDALNACVQEAKMHCPVSVVLKAGISVEINLDE